MRVLPLSRKSMVTVVALALLPFFPLVLVEYSVRDTIQWLWGFSVRETTCFEPP
jgi:hypothetical protein